MASLRFAFEPGGPQRVGVDWQGAWKDVSVQIDGRSIGRFADAAALRSGGRFRLADGSTLEVKLAQRPLPELQILRDGLPLPGSPSDPAERVRRAGHFIVAIGALSVAIGLVAAVAGIGFLTNAGFGLGSAVAGAVFGALGVPAGRGSLVALAVAVAVYVVEGVLAIAASAQSGSAGVPIARILFLIPMLQGLLAATELRGAPSRRHRSAPPPAAPPATQAAASPAPPPSASAAPDPVSRHRRALESRGLEATPAAGAARDRSADALRFVAPKLELLETGVCAVALDGRRRELAWTDLREVLVRKLPPDPPWNGALLVDLVPSAGPPVRILPATLANFSSLPGGAAPSRVENLRRLARLALERSSASVDAGTRSFVEGRGAPAAFATVRELAAHDARFA